MTITEMLDILQRYCTESFKTFDLPCAVQKGDTVQEHRPPVVYKMRLPHTNDATKLAPYCIVRYVTSRDRQDIGKYTKTEATVRFVFCVYSENESEGAIRLLDLMEGLRAKLLKDVVIEKRIKFMREEGLEMIAYEDDTAPYFAGEIIATFTFGPIERKVIYDGI